MHTLPRSSALYEAHQWTLIAAAGFLLTACGGGEKKPENAPSTGATSTVATPPVTPPSTAAPGAPATGALAPGATPAMVAQGDSIFHGQLAGGTCFTCHGPDAMGTVLAPALADDKWLTGDGSYSFIVNRVTVGMPNPTPPYTQPMLPKGGANLSADQVKAVAAYVYSISHKS